MNHPPSLFLEALTFEAHRYRNAASAELKCRSFIFPLLRFVRVLYHSTLILRVSTPGTCILVLETALTDRSVASQVER